MKGAFKADCAELSKGILCYRFSESGTTVSFGGALQLLRDDQHFLSLFTQALADSPFSAYRWETPPVTRETARRDFEFVLLDAPRLKRPPDPSVFAEHFSSVGDGEEVVVFEI
ncbi:MAG: hypothetical protein AAFN07_07655 [Pseudomonadota bacterium]